MFRLFLHLERPICRGRKTKEEQRADEWMGQPLNELGSIEMEFELFICKWHIIWF